LQSKNLKLKNGTDAIFEQRKGWTLSELAPIAQAITCFACNGLPVDRKWFVRAGFHRHGQ
jgi:hypothetical protein